MYYAKIVEFWCDVVFPERNILPYLKEWYNREILENELNDLSTTWNILITSGDLFLYAFVPVNKSFVDTRHSLEHEGLWFF